MDCKSCDICEFNMGVCAGRSDIYGKPIDEVKKSYPDGCDEFEISFSEFMNRFCFGEKGD